MLRDSMQWLSLKELEKIIEEMKARNHNQVFFDLRGINKEAFSRKNNDGYSELIEINKG